MREREVVEVAWIVTNELEVILMLSVVDDRSKVEEIPLLLLLSLRPFFLPSCRAVVISKFVSALHEKENEPPSRLARDEVHEQ